MISAQLGTGVGPGVVGSAVKLGCGDGAQRPVILGLEPKDVMEHGEPLIFDTHTSMQRGTHP